jgi:hypothetical protein
VPADDDSTCCSPKANPSSSSNSAMFSSVYPLSPQSEDLGRGWSTDSVRDCISSVSTCIDDGDERRRGRLMRGFGAHPGQRVEVAADVEHGFRRFAVPLLRSEHGMLLKYHMICPNQA